MAHGDARDGMAMIKSKHVVLALVCMGLAGWLSVLFFDHVIAVLPFPLNVIVFLAALVFMGWLWTQTEDKPE